MLLKSTPYFYKRVERQLTTKMLGQNDAHELLYCSPLYVVIVGNYLCGNHQCDGEYKKRNDASRLRYNKKDYMDDQSDRGEHTK